MGRPKGSKNKPKIPLFPTDLHVAVEKLSDEQKRFLIDEYNKAQRHVLPPKPTARLNPQSPETLARFHAHLFELMGPESPYQFIVARALKRDYQSICEQVDPLAKRWSERELNTYIVKWIRENNIGWEYRSAHLYNLPYVYFPNRHSQAAPAGWARAGTRWFDVEQMYPENHYGS